jgi:metal-responsive CopG/Arc/MetJ family transcriptional regulator
MSGTSVYIGDEKMVDEVDDRRHATTSRSEWIREAMLVRLYLEADDEWDAALARAREQEQHLIPDPDGGDEHNVPADD